MKLKNRLKLLKTYVQNEGVLFVGRGLVSVNVRHDRARLIVGLVIGIRTRKLPARQRGFSMA